MAEIGADLCDALAHAHSHGVVHRDIKPQNVIVREGPVPPGSVRAKVMDFGTASLVDAPGLTATGEVIGTIAYMAPEQAEGEAGPPADAYAMALTLYECWSGRHPFIRATPAATARAIGEPVAPLAEHRPDLPDRLCELIDACLVAQPEQRPGLEELGHGLDRVAPRLSAEEPVPVPRRRESLLAAPSEPAVAIARIGCSGAISALVAWLGVVAGRPGAALVAGLLMLPAPLLIQAPAGWGLPALAPLLGAIGVAPVYPALGTGAEYREPRGTRGARLGLAGGGRGGHGLSAALRHRGARTRRLERVPRRRGHARARSHPRAGVAARRRSLGRRRRGARGPDPPDRRTRSSWACSFGRRGWSRSTVHSRRACPSRRPDRSRRP